MEKTNWVIVDTETDGLLPPIQVVEISAQLMCGWEACGQPFQVFLNHNVFVPSAVVAIHGYSQEFLQKHGQMPTEAHGSFRAYAKDLPIVAHNLAFDWNRALMPEWNRLGLSAIGSRGFCTMLLSRRVLFNSSGFGLDALKHEFSLGEEPSRKHPDVSTPGARRKATQASPGGMEIRFNSRPHPGPLLRGEGETFPAFLEISATEVARWSIAPRRKSDRVNPLPGVEGRGVGERQN